MSDLELGGDDELGSLDAEGELETVWIPTRAAGQVPTPIAVLKLEITEVTANG